MDAYKFTEKLTGMVKYGFLKVAGVGTDTFATADGEEIEVKNDGEGDLSSDIYDVELVKDYTGETPTWSVPPPEKDE